MWWHPKPLQYMQLPLSTILTRKIIQYTPLCFPKRKFKSFLIERDWLKVHNMLNPSQILIGKNLTKRTAKGIYSLREDLHFKVVRCWIVSDKHPKEIRC